MGNRYNIFWFIIDSVRAFRTGKDDRDWLDIMDEFAEDSVHFTNAFTSAPSSRLAAGGFFTGLPTPFVSRHFNDWDVRIDELDTINTLVKKHGYHSYSLFDTRNARENYQNLVPPISTRLLPKGYHLSDYVWSNRDLTYIFDFLLEQKKIIQPCCATFWYDCRRDPNVSNHVAEAINQIKKNKYYEDSIIIMMSDHGYPDPDTNLNENFLRNVGHDVILTDDNIKTPLLLKYPGSPKGIRIDDVVGHIDVLPTIFDILNLQYNSGISKYQGTSLLPLINGIEKNNNRVRRTDTRLPMDTQRMVSFRNNLFKYIYVFEDNIEFLFDLRTDQYERCNFINNPEYKEILSDFQKLKNESEKAIFAFHKKHLLNNAGESLKFLKKKYKSNKVTILIVTKAQEDLLDILCDCLNSHLNCDTIDLLALGKHTTSSNKISHVYSMDKVSREEILKHDLDKYTIMLFLTANSRRIFLESNIKSTLNEISAKHSRVLDYNFIGYNSLSKLLYIPNIKLFFNWSVKGFFYNEEPIYFIKDLLFFTKRLIRRIFTKEKDIDIMAAKEIIEFRNYHLNASKEFGLEEMSQDTLSYEIARIKTRDD